MRYGPIEGHRCTGQLAGTLDHRLYPILIGLCGVANGVLVWESYPMLPRIASDRTISGDILGSLASRRRASPDSRMARDRSGFFAREMAPVQVAWAAIGWERKPVIPARCRGAGLRRVRRTH